MTDLLPYTPQSLATAADPEHAIDLALENGKAWLVEATDLTSIREATAKAAAIQTIARQLGLSRDAEDKATELRIRCERRMGQVLADQPKATGTRGAGRPPIGGPRPEPPKPTPTLADLGIDKKQAATAQALAAPDDDTFDNAVETAKELAEGAGLSRAGVLRNLPGAAEKAQREAARQADLAEQNQWIKDRQAEAEPFDEKQNDIDTAQRGALLRLSRETWERLGDPDAFVAHHGRRLRASHIDSIRRARDWCDRFLAAAEAKEAS